jgi:hypothetical protein
MTDMITADYVRAQWAYSELLSLGHGQRYTGQGVPELREKARSGVPFDELGTAEHYLLVDQFDRVRGRYLNRYLLGITAFRRVEWTRQDLGAVYVIPYFLRDVVSQDLVSLLRLTFKDWIEAEPVRPLHQVHARYAAYGAAPPSTSDVALTVGCYPEDGLLLLLDGYHRAVKFWSRSDLGTKLSVYVPEEP